MRHHTLSYTSGSVSANSSLDENKTTLGCSMANLVRIKVTPNTAGGNCRVQIFGKDTFLTADLMYNAGPDSNIIDPIERGTDLERTQYFVCNYEDRDGTGELHIRIYNDDGVAKTFAVEIDYEPVRLWCPPPIAIPDNTITDIFDVVLPNDTMAGFIMNYTITFDDGSNQQVESGVLQISMYNNGGTKSTTTPTNAGTPLQALSAGSLTMAWATASTALGTKLRLTANTSMTASGVLTYTLVNNSGRLLSTTIS